MNINKSFNTAIQHDAEVEPCIKFNCRYYEKCKNELLACSAFSGYVQTGTSNDPTTKGVYPPTNAQYLSIFKTSINIDSDIGMNH